mgnify:CR=1 FL=1
MLKLDIRMGTVKMSRDSSVEEVYRFITFIWSCTNFLVPKTNG